MSTSWAPAASREMLAHRARVLDRIRTFMNGRGILEVETPVLSRAGATDPNIRSVTAAVHGPGNGKAVPVWLHTSPEFPMKRLLAAGSGPIYQITRVFRDEESGRIHQPEFTMLEWYRPGFDHHALMDELAALLDGFGLPGATRVSYADTFEGVTGLDPHTCGMEPLERAARDRGLRTHNATRAMLLEFLFSSAAAPLLGRQGPEFIYDYPESEAALARLRRGAVTVAERFELFLSGMEIANGFHELCDAGEQRERLLQDNVQRRDAGLPEVRIDENLLAALEHGLPDCAGVAVGLDRLIMVLAGRDCIDEVLAFPFARA